MATTQLLTDLTLPNLPDVGENNPSKDTDLPQQEYGKANTVKRYTAAVNNASLLLQIAPESISEHQKCKIFPGGGGRESWGMPLDSPS